MITKALRIIILLSLAASLYFNYRQHIAVAALELMNGTARQMLHESNEREREYLKALGATLDGIEKEID